MSETLHTCTACGQAGFTARGLKAHEGNKTCKARASTALVVEHGTGVINDDAVKGAQLTTQYHRATGGMKEVVIFGAMMMQLREEHPEMAQRGGDRKSKSTVDNDRLSLGKWLEKYAPEVKRATAIRFLHVTESIATSYKEIVGAKVAKLMPLPQLVTTPAADLPQGCEAKQLALFDFVNGTSQKSWLDMFSPESPQKRGHKTKQEQGNDTLKPKTAAELKADAEEEISTILNLLAAWFQAGHQNRVDADTRETAVAVLEESITKINAVK
jgi:hypothetical protein